MTDRSDAISAALARQDKGELGIHHHRWVRTDESILDDDGEWILAYGVVWCWDCGTGRDEAEQRPYPSAWPQHATGELGFCGYTAKTPGPWWTKPDLDVVDLDALTKEDASCRPDSPG